ncbi:MULTISPECIES: MFS transporter [unclassified Burkholderia]|uniref:MFS transporter n=1 Tax=unclassified Burkholderia TaxID=2613784 RepID=UPI000F56F719|nr:MULTISPECIES: MFS transporter [unclassified Burkholderia]RQR68775.1 MFS transporter [Burkholderia sp. Bp9012]RQR70266.1 MFS transporter [Burkholderia sp. Bp9011]RQR83027.1 MFS transporter [Burkholderia sp. Bp9010]RQZ39437.1 MFS transporter [Burkholderia sp. Bp9099]
MQMLSTPRPAMIKRVILASVIGNAFEWFDFVIYGVFATTIARLYFPTANTLASLSLMLATFGVGFLVRPLGGVVLGVYGDRVGRRKALSLTISLMALGTGMIGLMPTYAAIGIGAPILIMVARIIQGISAGAEFSVATTMLVEFAPANRRGFFGSFQMCAQALATSCGAAVAWLLSAHLDGAQFEAWGWRLPFLFGMLVGPVGWLIRSTVDESPEFLAHVRATARDGRPVRHMSLKHLIANHKRSVLSGIGFCVVGTVSAFVFNFFVPIFAKQQLGISAANASYSTFISTAIVVVLCPLTGHLSDRVGRVAVLQIGVVGYGLTAWFLFHRFVAAPSFQTLLELQIGVAIFMGFIWGPAPIVLAEIFPVEVRATGTALVYNVSVMIFGGAAPFINTWLVNATGSNLAPIYYVTLSAVIGFFGVCLLPKRVGTGTVARTV